MGKEAERAASKRLKQSGWAMMVAWARMVAGQVTKSGWLLNTF